VIRRAYITTVWAAGTYALMVATVGPYNAWLMLCDFIWFVDELIGWVPFISLPGRAMGCW